jgi:hypothetical protein
LILLGGLIVGGTAFLIRRGEVFIPLYIVTSATLMCVTPWPDQFKRYLVPVAPFLLASLFSCVLGLGNWLRLSRRNLVPKFAPIPALIVLALIFDAEGHSLFKMYSSHLDIVRSETWDGRVVDYRVFYYSAASKSLDDALGWLKQRTKPADVVATSMPHWAYVSKGLKAVRPPIESDGERTQTLLDSIPVAYIILSPENDGKAINEYFFPFVQSSPHAWKSVYVDEQQTVVVYQRARSDAEDKRK